MSPFAAASPINWFKLGGSEPSPGFPGISAMASATSFNVEFETLPCTHRARSSSETPLGVRDPNTLSSAARIGVGSTELSRPEVAESISSEAGPAIPSSSSTAPAATRRPLRRRLTTRTAPGPESAAPHSGHPGLFWRPDRSKLQPRHARCSATRVPHSPRRSSHTPAMSTPASTATTTRPSPTVQPPSFTAPINSPIPATRCRPTHFSSPRATWFGVRGSANSAVPI